MGISMKKKPHNGAFKLKVALSAIKGDRTTAELCQEFGIVSSQLFKWKKELLEKGDQVFGGSDPKKTDTSQIDKLHATIGRLKVENDFLERALGKSR